MFERFTDRARRIVVLAQEEARMLGHNYIGTEHLLLGLIHEGEGVGAQALESLDVSLSEVREQVVVIVGEGTGAPAGHVPFTPRGKKVLELSLREALQLGHNYIGSEHILLGIVREGEGIAAQVLQAQGVTLESVRQQVLRLLAEITGQPAEAAAEGHALPLSPGSGFTHGFFAPRRPPWWSYRRRRSAPGRHGVCLGCGGDLTETAAYRVHTVPAHEGEGTRNVLFVFCTSCGSTFTGQVLPSGEGDAGGEPETGA
jgi:ATP-dependent Clp protease ATP-binding subunit ClpA